MSDRPLDAYLAIVTFASLPILVAVAPAALHPRFTLPVSVVVLLALVTIAAELVPVKVARGRQVGDEISVTTFSIVLLLVAPLGIVIAVQAAGLLLDELLRRGLWSRLPFNIAPYAIAFSAAHLVLAATGFSSPRLPGDHPGDFLLAFAAAGSVFYLVNHGLTGTAVALKLNAPIRSQLLDDLRWDTAVSLTLIGLAPVVVLVVGWTPWGLIPLMAPIVAVHRSGHIAMQREFEALHDTLTGLPNRALLNLSLRRLVRTADTVPVALLLIDLDHFKEINDTLGHQMGDEVLRQVAGRLSAEVGEEGIVSRLGGDEFAVLAPIGQNAALALASRLVAALTIGFDAGELRLDVRGSVGVGLAPLHARDGDELMRVADVALYRAKETRGEAMLYDRGSDMHSLARLALHGDLRQAVARGAIHVDYQPQVDLEGHFCGLEALARWRHEDLGEISPEVFIPIAESAGLMPALTRIVLTQACQQYIRWEGASSDVKLAVNLSARHLTDMSLPALVADVMRDTGFPVANLVLEVTEGSIMSDPIRGATVLQRLRALGVKLSIDDFGTGYSSLSYLSQLPVDELKIDRSFVGDLGASSINQAIVRSTIELAHNLGLGVVAEGVEDVTSLELLHGWGCDLVQGFLIARPMDPASFSVWRRLATRPPANVPAQPTSPTESVPAEPLRLVPAMLDTAPQVATAPSMATAPLVATAPPIAQ